MVAADAERQTIAHRMVRRTNSTVRLFGLVHEKIKRVPAGRGESSFALVLPVRGCPMSARALSANPDRSWTINEYPQCHLYPPGYHGRDVRTKTTDDKVNDEVAAVELVKVGPGRHCPPRHGHAERDSSACMRRHQAFALATMSSTRM